MKTLRFLAALATVAGGLAISSCYPATGEERPPKLRPLPQFNDVQGMSGSPAVDYAK